MFSSIVPSLIIGYLLGSIPFGLLLTRAAGLGDVRSIGSGNIGATNVLRTGNKGLAAATLLLDMLKGTAAVVIAGWYFQSNEAALAAGFGAFIGHIFPVWLGFKGGKGVATYLGVLLGFGWAPAAIFAVIWIAMAVIFRYSSLAALTGVSLTPLILFLLDRSPESIMLALVAAVMGIIIIYKHRANIERLRAGTETRIGSKG